MNKIRQGQLVLRDLAISILSVNLFGATLEEMPEINNKKQSQVPLKICIKNLKAFSQWDINKKMERHRQLKLRQLEKQKERTFM
jgi:hypothetical protein